MSAHQTDLPLAVESRPPNTLDYLRRQIDLGIKAARASMQAIIDHDDLGWIWDEVMDDEFYANPWSIGNQAGTFLDQLRKANRLEDGYDSWDSKKLEKHKQLLREAAAQLGALHQAYVNLRAAELSELRHLGVSPTIPRL
jgi:hypothetical protein